MQLNPALARLPVYQPGRPIEEVARELGLPAAEIIKLASNENPLGPSPQAVAAMQNALREIHLYPDGNAFHLRRKLAEKLELNPANIVFGNGSNEILEFVGHALLGPGTEAVASQYCFAVYPIVTQLFGARLITVPARPFGHDLEAMLAAITPETRVVFVANPNNPTGTRVRNEALRRFAQAVPPRVLLVLDEAYLEFLDDPPDFLPWLRSDARPNLLLLRTFSKIHGLAGLRIGYGLGHPDFVRALERIRQPFNLNALAQAAALAALDDDAHVAATRDNNTRGLGILAQGFTDLGLEFVPSAANFILARVGDGQEVFAALLRRGVIVRPMGGYQLPEWIRVSVGNLAENQRCLAVLREVLKHRRPTV